MRRAVPQEAVRRVTVYSDTSCVDLVLAAAVPIGSLIPPIVDRVLTADSGRGTQPLALRHQLSVPGDIALDSSKTLAQLGIRDGTVLTLTSSSTPLAPPRFDDVAEAVSESLAPTVRPWTRQRARLVGGLTAGWLAGAAAVVVTGMPFHTNAVPRIGCAGVAAAAGFIALLAAVISHRAFRDKIVALTLGLAASGFAALAGLLAVPGALGAPNVLLAMAAAATWATAMQMTGCCATVFRALACFATAAGAAALVGALSAVPLQVIGAASATISLILVEVSAPMSIMLAGLSSHVTSEPDTDRLNANVIRASSWLTSLIGALSASAAWGAIGAAAGSCFGGGTPWLGIAFAAVTGSVLLLRARSHRDLARSAPLVVAGTATLSATLVIAAIAYPPHTPYVAAASTLLAAAALCLGFLTHTMTFSPVGRRGIELLEYLALAVIVPTACWICGFYGTVRGMNLL